MSSNSLMSNDLSDLCRVCLQLPEESQYLDLTTIYDEEDNLTYGECFTICTQINLSDGEGVPHHLCKSCGLELQMTYDFYKKVEESKRLIEQCRKQVNEQTLNASDQRNNKNDIKLLNDTDLELSDKHDTDVSSRGESSLKQKRNVIRIANNNDQTSFKEQQKDLILDTSIQAESSQDSNVGADIEEHLDMEDYQNFETLEEEEKSNKSIKSVKIKKEFECEYEYEDPLVENSETIIGNYITSGFKLENDASNVSDKILDEIKIEDDSLSDYIVSTPTIIPNIYPPIPTHIANEENSSNKATSSRRFFRGEAIYECEICGFRLPTENGLFQHRLRKHKDKEAYQRNPKSFKCRICSKNFAVMSSLRVHLYTGHNMGFTCEHCGYNLPTKNALYQHRLRKHKNFKIKLKCIQSAENSKTLENQRSANKRRVVKEDETWIECTDCGYKLPTRNAFYQHRLRKHRNR